ncbi:MAG: hypothetical protein AAF653_04920, partial [Chloroflexota bacterium]
QAVTDGVTPSPTRTLAPVDADGVLPTALPATSTPGTAVAVVPPPENNVPPAAPPAELLPVDGGGLPLEVIAGSVAIVAVVAYAGLFLAGTVAADRYAGGFVVEECPVCQRGTLTVDSRADRVVGIPRTKRIVRCNECRSILREVGPRRWRYAIDPLENSELYQQYNGRVIDDNTLGRLGSDEPKTPPQFVDEE